MVSGWGDCLRHVSHVRLAQTAFRINPLIGSKDHFWQQEPFDHLVRSIEQYNYLRNYIAQNPEKAGLKLGEFYNPGNAELGENCYRSPTNDVE